MPPSNGKLALVASADVMNTCGDGLPVVDRFGYAAFTDCYETAPFQSLSPFLSALRKGDGCRDTDDNPADFVTATPHPRNSASPAVACVLSPTAVPSPATSPRLALAASPNPATHSLAIAYALPGRGAATLALVDVAGRSVRTLAIDGAPGPRLVHLDGLARLAPGVYVVRVAQGATSASAVVTITR
jgi:hypothetical protein